MQQITVRVPASTSNLGPGYDCLGVALRIYNTVTVSRVTSRGQVHPPIVAEAANRFFKQVRRGPFSFSCCVAEQIPRSRGLGSSATIRLGILFALNRFCDNALDPMKLFQLCAELERHPDNAAPATFGGFTVVNRASVSADGKEVVPVVQRFEVSARLHFVLFVPDFEIQTVTARNLLPSKISHAAAVENCANACALTAAFVSQDYEQLRGVFGDHLHQPFRAKLIPFLPRVLHAAVKAGALGAFLSGSGSTIAAVTLQSARRIAAAMARSAKTAGRTIITQADDRGARVVRSPITIH